MNNPTQPVPASTAPEQATQEIRKRQRDPVIRILKLVLIALIISLFVILIIELISHDNGIQYGGFFSKEVGFDVMTPSEIMLTAIPGIDM